MTAWFTTPETTPRATCPDTRFVTFAANNFKPPASFLEIGSGSGANLRWLEQQGFKAHGVDPAPEAYADFHQDVCEFLSGSPTLYDCIFDINTLCHVEKPPYEAISRALKPDGIFFSITPALDTEADFTGKGYTCRSSRWSLRVALDPFFSNVDIRPACYPSRGKNITSWVVEADK